MPRTRQAFPYGFCCFNFFLPTFNNKRQRERERETERERERETQEPKGRLIVVLVVVVDVVREKVNPKWKPKTGSNL